LHNPFTNIPPVTKYIAITIVISYVFSLVLEHQFIVGLLALIPAHTIPPNMYIWNLLTCAFIELSAIDLVLSIFGLLTFGKYLEPLWGVTEFIRFIIIIILSSSLLSFLFSIMLYHITKDETQLYLASSGFNGVIAGFTVAFKQLRPDTDLLFVLLPLRAKYLPFLYLIFSVPMIVFGFSQRFVVFGLLIGWIYLRFYQRQPGGSKGDRSKDFAFASMFYPEAVLQPIVGKFANVVWAVVVKLRLCKDVVGKEGGFGEEEEEEIGGGANDSFDTQRRRALAMKAVDSRMEAKLKTKQQKETPSFVVEAGGNGVSPPVSPNT